MDYEDQEKERYTEAEIEAIIRENEAQPLARERLFKPSRCLYVLLFIYYSIWLMQAYGALRYYLSYGLEETSWDLYPWQWVTLAFFAAAAVYSFYAVIKTLRGDRDCIAALKWSLIVILLYTLVNPVRYQSAVAPGLMRTVGFLIRPAFYAAFYLYLCFSKSIRARYPKSLRRGTPARWIWMGLIGGMAVTAPFDACHERSLERYGAPIEEAEFSLAGRDSSGRTYRASGYCERLDSRTANRLVVAAAQHVMTAEPGDWSEHGEQAHDVTAGEAHVATSIFTMRRDSVEAWIAVSVVTDTLSPLCTVVVRSAPELPGRDWSAEAARLHMERLQRLSEREHGEDHGDERDELSCRTRHQYQHADADVASGLLDRLQPRHSARIAALEHHEAEVAHREEKHVFQYLEYGHGLKFGEAKL